MSKPIYAEELPAFPTFNTPELYPEQRGMTMRDYFAAKAMQGVCASDVMYKADSIAKDAYEIADAMLKAREAK